MSAGDEGRGIVLCDGPLDGAELAVMPKTDVILPVCKSGAAHAYRRQKEQSKTGPIVFVHFCPVGYIAVPGESTEDRIVRMICAIREETAPAIRYTINPNPGTSSS